MGSNVLPEQRFARSLRVSEAVVRPRISLSLGRTTSTPVAAAYVHRDGPSAPKRASKTTAQKIPLYFRTVS
jgi:hypothetical protein